MPKVSIIVPVYKAEPYLSKCIDRILSQSYQDFELILVDDGSPDNSGVLCDQYASKDPRVKVIHKENGGVSSARNRGINEANGEWITFVDADDWILPTTLAVCSGYFAEYDVIRFSMKIVRDEKDDRKNRDVRLDYCIDKKEIIGKVLSRSCLLCVCGGFYKSDLFRKTKIQFDTSLIMAEDWLVLVELLAISKKIINLPDVFYNYNQLNEASCSNNPTLGKIENCFQALDKICTLEDINNGVYDTFILTGRCVIWKAMIHEIAHKTPNVKEFVNILSKEKNVYYYPHINEIFIARVPFLSKVILLSTIIKPLQYVLYSFIKKLSR